MQICIIYRTSCVCYASNNKKGNGHTGRSAPRSPQQPHEKHNLVLYRPKRRSRPHARLRRDQRRQIRRSSRRWPRHSPPVEDPQVQRVSHKVEPNKHARTRVTQECVTSCRIVSDASKKVKTSPTPSLERTQPKNDHRSKTTSQ